MLYRILLFSVKPQHESATGYTYVPSLLNLPPISLPSRLITEPLFEFPETYSKFPLAIYFTYGNVSFHTLNIHLTLFSPLPMSIGLFSMSVSPLLPYSHQDSMVLAQKQKYRSMEQDRKPRNKPMHLWLPYF